LISGVVPESKIWSQVSGSVDGRVQEDKPFAGEQALSLQASGENDRKYVIEYFYAISNF
jgi:hypothetical protein